VRAPTTSTPRATNIEMRLLTPSGEHCGIIGL
jgi:hypothetical protein